VVALRLNKHVDVVLSFVLKCDSFCAVSTTLNNTLLCVTIYFHLHLFYWSDFLQVLLGNNWVCGSNRLRSFRSEDVWSSYLLLFISHFCIRPHNDFRLTQLHYIGCLWSSEWRLGSWQDHVHIVDKRVE
jgi:hypothetical protein